MKESAWRSAALDELLFCTRKHPKMCDQLDSIVLKEIGGKNSQEVQRLGMCFLVENEKELKRLFNNHDRQGLAALYDSILSTHLFTDWGTPGRLALLCAWKSGFLGLQLGNALKQAEKTLVKNADGCTKRKMEDSRDPESGAAPLQTCKRAAYPKVAVSLKNTSVPDENTVLSIREKDRIFDPLKNARHLGTGTGMRPPEAIEVNCIKALAGQKACLDRLRLELRVGEGFPPGPLELAARIARGDPKTKEILDYLLDWIRAPGNLQHCRKKDGSPYSTYWKTNVEGQLHNAITRYRYEHAENSSPAMRDLYSKYGAYSPNAPFVNSWKVYSRETSAGTDEQTGKRRANYRVYLVMPRQVAVYRMAKDAVCDPSKPHDSMFEHVLAGDPVCCFFDLDLKIAVGGMHQESQRSLFEESLLGLARVASRGLVWARIEATMSREGGEPPSFESIEEEVDSLLNTSGKSWWLPKLCSGRLRDDGKSEKLSAHLVCSHPGYAFESLASLKVFASSPGGYMCRALNRAADSEEWARFVIGKPQEGDCFPKRVSGSFIDAAPYSGGNLRCLFSCKLDESRYPMRPYGECVDFRNAICDVRDAASLLDTTMINPNLYSCGEDDTNGLLYAKHQFIRMGEEAPVGKPGAGKTGNSGGSARFSADSEQWRPAGDVNTLCAIVRRWAEKRSDFHGEATKLNVQYAGSGDVVVILRNGKGKNTVCCPIVGRPHESNSTTINVKVNARAPYFTVGCMDPDCNFGRRGKKQVKKEIQDQLTEAAIRNEWYGC